MSGATWISSDDTADDINFRFTVTEEQFLDLYISNYPFSPANGIYITLELETGTYFIISS
jgi:hypothetical protein